MAAFQLTTEDGQRSGLRAAPRDYRVEQLQHVVVQVPSTTTFRILLN
jgi:hypothetical protein